MKVKCLKHDAVPRPRLEPGPFDPEASVLAIRPPSLHFANVWFLLRWLTTVLWDTIAQL